MALTFTLVDSTPDRQRYLLEGGVEDLTATLDHATLLANCATDPAGSLQTVINAPAATQAAARAFMNSDDAAGTFLTNNNVLRAVLEITPRTLAIPWAVDANTDGVNSEIVVVKAGGTASAYLDIKMRHTFDL